MRDKGGFTLIELIMVIVILGILAVVAFPRYYDLTEDANTAAEQGVVGGVRAGIHTYFAQNRTWPTNLDTAAVGTCDTSTGCFVNVLSQGGITSADWNKTAANAYTGPAGTAYTYTSGTGEFE